MLVVSLFTAESLSLGFCPPHHFPSVFHSAKFTGETASAGLPPSPGAARAACLPGPREGKRRA